MAIDKIKSTSIEDNSVTTEKIAPGAVTISDISDNQITMAKLSQVNLSIAPEVLTIQVDAPQANQDVDWLWTWQQSTLPYARRTITNSFEANVPLYKQGIYTVNNFAGYELHDDMTQTHTLYLKWIDGAGTDNNVSWAVNNPGNPITASHPDINGGNPTQVQQLNISVPSTINAPTLVAPSVSYTVTNNGAGAYTFSGPAQGDNLNIGPWYRGGTYTFNISAIGHPLYLTTDNGTNFSMGGYFGEYTDGVTGSRTDNGTLTITVPQDAPDTLYYQCSNHSPMFGAITVKDLAVDTNANGNFIVYFQHTQEGHKTPVELRPIPSLVNQMCLVYDQTTDKFVPQDLATYVENTPSFKRKIQEVAGTATLVGADGDPIVSTVNIYYDSTYLPLLGNNEGDLAFATDTGVLYVWQGSAWVGTGITDADVQNIINQVLDGAPAALNTLNELAAALGDDPNFATTITNSIASKQDQLVSGTNIKTVNGGSVLGTGDLVVGAQQDVFYENSQTLNANYTITTGKSAMSTGPIEIAAGVTVEIPSGSRWVIV